MDAAVEDGSEVGIFYDPMISKVITRGEDRAAALSVHAISAGRVCRGGPGAQRALLSGCVQS